MTIKELKILILNHDIEKLNEYIQNNNITDLSYTDESGNTFLHLASHKESDNTLKLFKILYNLGGDLNSVNENFQTPLEYAVEKNNKMAIFALKILDLEKDIIL